MNVIATKNTSLVSRLIFFFSCFIYLWWSISEVGHLRWSIHRSVNTFSYQESDARWRALRFSICPAVLILKRNSKNSPATKKTTDKIVDVFLLDNLRGVFERYKFNTSLILFDPSQNIENKRLSGTSSTNNRRRLSV